MTQVPRTLFSSMPGLRGYCSGGKGDGNMAHSPGQNAGTRPRVSARAGGLGRWAWGPTGRKSKPPPASGPVTVVCLLCWKYSSPHSFFFSKLSASGLTSNVTSLGRPERSHRRAWAGRPPRFILPTSSHDQCEGMEGFPGRQSVGGEVVHWTRASLVPDE